MDSLLKGNTRVNYPDLIPYLIRALNQSPIAR